jgi:hypothetical protein
MVFCSQKRKEANEKAKLEPVDGRTLTKKTADILGEWWRGLGTEEMQPFMDLAAAENAKRPQPKASKKK